MPTNDNTYEGLLCDYCACTYANDNEPTGDQDAKSYTEETCTEEGSEAQALKEGQKTITTEKIRGCYYTIKC